MLISSAFAQAAGAADTGSGANQQILLMIGVAVFFWFFIMRPQMKKGKDAQKLLTSLREGDEVMTHSGLAGRITKIADNFIKVEIAENVVITVQKQAIASILPEGTLNSL